MAVDTQEKRMAATGVGRPWMRGKLPGTNDQEWRIASGNGYGGNEIAAPPEEAVTLPTVIRRGAVTEGSLARYTTVTSQAIRRTAEDNDVIRRT